MDRKRISPQSVKDMSVLQRQHSFSAISSSPTGRESSTKKRKSQFDVKEENSNDKPIERDAGEISNNVSEIQKTDYIHVRARSGQATDSHSLAERARREKISKKMKYLQDLVPGCDKVSGKAGMLDEIINYVQSLQRQVEFLSTKLADLNPILDLEIDNFLAKATTHPEVTNLSYLQYKPDHQGAISCGIVMPMNPNQMASQQTASSSMSMPELHVDSSYFPQVQSMSTYSNDMQSLYNLRFH